MQQYIIKSFKRASDDAIFERQEAGTNSGGYVYRTEVRRLNDFLCDGGFTIHSILRQQLVVANSLVNRNETFTIGDRLQNFANPIQSIKIILSEVVLFTTTTSRSSVGLTQAIKFAEPVRQTVVTGNGVNTTQTTTQTNTNAFSEIEATILSRNPRPIRLERTLKRRRETLQEFLVLFFQEWNDEKNTIYVDDSSIQTETGKRRSLGDIYMICKYYYPDCTLNQVLK